jgi:hypothetical protein
MQQSHSQKQQDIYSQEVVTDGVLMSPFCEAAKMAAQPLNRNSCALRQPRPYQRLPRMRQLPYPPPSIKATPGPGWLLGHLSPAGLGVSACH